MTEKLKVGREIELTSTGLIKELAEFMLEGVPTHPDWVESLACGLVGTMVGSERYLMNSYGKVNGNPFVIYIGASGLSFKTVPLKNHVRPMLMELSTAINTELLEKAGVTTDEFDKRWKTSTSAPSRTRGTNEWKQERAYLENMKSQFVDLMTLQRFTTEKLTSWLTEFPQGMIVGDEFTKMFQGTSKKDYLAGNMEDMSRLYDCDVEKVGTQSRGVEYPEKAYVSFCSATTYYLLKLMDDDFFIQGTGNRIMWILDDFMEKVDVENTLRTMMFFWRPDNEAQFEEQKTDLVQKLMNIRFLPTGLVEVGPAASVELDRYRLNKYNEAVDFFIEDLLDKDANLVARLAQNAMKLALIHCIGRYAVDPRGLYETNMEIDLIDAKWAIAKMERHYEYYKKLREVAVQVRSTTTKSYANDQERVIFIIQRLELKEKTLTANVLRQQTGWMKDDCQRLLDTMVANKQLQLVTELRGVRQVLFYKVHPDYNPS